LSIYISSPNLQIEQGLSVDILDISNINKIKSTDIVISTATLYDDLILRNLIDLHTLPFIVTFDTSNSVSELMKNLTLIIDRDIEIVTADIINEIKEIQTSILEFEKSLELIKLKETTELINLYQSIHQLYNYSYSLKSTEPKEIKKRDIFIDIKDNISYIILEDNRQRKIFEVQNSNEKLIRNSFDKYFEELMSGESVELGSRRVSLYYKDISHRLDKDFMLFGIDDIDRFETYFRLNSSIERNYNHIALYDISKDVKDIDEIAITALKTLSKLFYTKEFKNNEIVYNNLEVFLISTSSFREIVSGIPKVEQNPFKRNVINGMIEKIYENMRENRSISNLRFALVCLKEDLSNFNQNIKNHIFYDIQNGINVNREIQKSLYQDIKISTNKKKELVDNYNSNDDVIDEFIKKNDRNHFISSFLNTILSMPSSLSWNIDNVIELVSYMSYISSTDNIKVRKIKNIEKIQIAHCFMLLVELLSSLNRAYFILLLKNFLEYTNEISIEEFLQKDIEYNCSTNKIDKTVTIEIYNNLLTVTNSTLRKRNSRFFHNILVIGNFFKAISKEDTIDDIISTSLYQISHNRVNIDKCCQNPITPKFLSLFLDGRNRKDCEMVLQKFLRFFDKNISTS